MSKEIVVHGTTGLTLYFLVRNTAGQVWNTSGTPAFENYNASNYGDYDIALTEQGATGIYYGDFPTAIAAGEYDPDIRRRVGGSPAVSDPVYAVDDFVNWDGSARISSRADVRQFGGSSNIDVYQAKVSIFDDNQNGEDQYAVVFFKNSQPVVAGITSPTIQVFKVSDGSDLIASTALTQIGATGTYKFNESTNRMLNSDAYIALVSATIDGSARTWYQPVGRDS